MKKKEKLVEVEKEHTECLCGEHCGCKKNNILFRLVLSIILLLGTFLVGLGLGGYVLFKDNTDDKQLECEKVESNKEDKVEKNEDDKATEEEYLTDYDNVLRVINDLSRIEQVNRNIETIDDLTNKEILLFAIDRLGYAKNHSLEDVNQITNAYFGVDVVPEDVDCHYSSDEAPLFLYDKDKKEFVVNEEHGGHGLGDYYADVLNRIISFEVDGSTYTVKVKKAFGRLQDTGPVTDYYKSYGDMVKFAKPLFDFTTDNLEELDWYYPEVEFANVSNDKLITYTYVFEKVEENFVLKSYVFK